MNRDEFVDERFVSIGSIEIQLSSARVVSLFNVNDVDLVLERSQTHPLELNADQVAPLSSVHALSYELHSDFEETMCGVFFVRLCRVCR